MNFTQMHERLRLELLRRIQRGTLSVSLLARQTGFGQPHLSNFLRSRRQLSLEAMDRILAAQHLTVADLLPAIAQERILAGGRERRGGPGGFTRHGALRAGHPAFRGADHAASAARRSAYLCAPGPTNLRRAWQRFVAIRVSPADALPMEPLVLPEAIALIDRHYNSLLPYRPNRPNLYAVRHGAHLTLRYAEFQSSRLVLRPHNIAFPVELIVMDPEESPSDLLTGRVALILNEI